MYRVQVDLASVVDLLSRHLYSDPDVFVRELLQNAVDAVHARQLTDGTTGGGITVEVGSGAEPVLVVEDDGIGLTEQQIHEFLATVGRSTKRDELELARGDFLGQFGIGLLSGFLVADEIVVVTRSAAEGRTWQWTGRADGTYEVTALEAEHPIGTTVVLRVRPGEEQRLAPERIRRAVLRYASMLPQRVTLRIGGHETVVGGRPLPWADLDGTPAEDRRQQLLDWAESRFEQRFLDVIPLHSPTSESTGVAFVHAEARSPGSRQLHLVTLKGMLLTESADQLLPDWAFFVRCALDTRGLRPTASREALVDDDLMRETREVLGGQIRQWLLDTAARRPDRLRSFVALHQTSLKALAVHDGELLSAIAEWLPVETSLGTLTLGELSRRGEPIRFTPSLDAFRQLAQVSAAQGMCLVNGGYTYDTELLRQLPGVSGVDVVQVVAEDLVSDLAEVETSAQSAAMALSATATRALHGHGVVVTVRDFRPTSVPALLVVDPDSRYRRSLSRGRSSSDGFWGQVLEGVEALWDDRPDELCLNAGNEIVRALLRSPEGERTRAALQLLYVQSLLLGHHPLDTKELRLMSSSVLAMLQEPA